MRSDFSYSWKTKPKSDVENGDPVDPTNVVRSLNVFLLSDIDAGTGLSGAERASTGQSRKRWIRILRCVFVAFLTSRSSSKIVVSCNESMWRTLRKSKL